MRTLDRSRPFGISMGAADGPAFSQDGVGFDKDGREIVPEAAPAAEAPSVPKNKGGRPRKHPI